MRAMRSGWIVVLLALVAVGCSTDTTDPDFGNPLDPRNENSIEPPDSVGVLVGNNMVKLVWTGPVAEEVDEYAVFRRRLDVVEEEEMKKVGQTREMFFLDRQVRNGRVYAYEVAAGFEGGFGKRSEELEARPGSFSVVIQNDVAVTNQRSTQVALAGPNGTEAVQLSENEDFGDASWRRFGTTTNWVLSLGDGEKTVYARFRVADGTESFPVFDTINLDTRAEIRSVTFSGETVKIPGDLIHFEIDAEEVDGAAFVDIQGLFSGLVLYDDGTKGDHTANDGLYERDAWIPAGTTVNGAEVRGRFNDLAGNSANQVVAARTIWVRQPPEEVELLELSPSSPPDPAQVAIRWSQSLENDFSAYRVYRDTDADVDGSDHLVGTVNSKGSTELTDSQVEEGVTYYYRVFVRTGSGLEAGSNTLSLGVPNLRPPSAITLAPSDGEGTTRVALSWSASSDRDFAAYRLYRNESGAVDDSDVLVKEITDVDRTFADDTGLTENTVYYYRVYVLDTAGLFSRSNEEEARTANDPPPSVTLNTATAVNDTSAALSWSESDAHDFDSYRLYRSLSPAVSTASVLVAEITEVDGTSYVDTQLEESTRYYYRVFVRDDGPQTESTGSNTVEVNTQASP